METLEQVQEYLNGIPCINCGGCGVSAISMYKWLKKHDNGRVKFVYLYTSRTTYLNNEAILRNKRTGKPEAPSHCCIYYDGQFLDSKGQVDMERYNWFQIIDEPDFVEKSIQNEDSWNESFDRDNIPKIEKKLEIDLSEVKD